MLCRIECCNRANMGCGIYVEHRIWEITDQYDTIKDIQFMMQTPNKCNGFKYRTCGRSPNFLFRNRILTLKDLSVHSFSHCPFPSWLGLFYPLPFFVLSSCHMVTRMIGISTTFILDPFLTRSTKPLSSNASSMPIIVFELPHLRRSTTDFHNSSTQVFKWGPALAMQHYFNIGQLGLHILAPSMGVKMSTSQWWLSSRNCML